MCLSVKMSGNPHQMFRLTLSNAYKVLFQAKNGQQDENRVRKIEKKYKCTVYKCKIKKAFLVSSGSQMDLMMIIIS